MKGIKKVSKRLFISSFPGKELDHKMLKQKCIDCVLNVSEFSITEVPNEIVYRHIQFRDGEYISMEKLKKIHEFLKEFVIEKEMGILVFCRRGISRSGGICALILMMRDYLSFEAAKQEIRRTHYICPAKKIEDSIIRLMEKNRPNIAPWDKNI